MHLAPRILVAAIIFAALTGASLAAAGLAEDGPPQGSPAMYGTAESLPGDRGVYKTALVVVDGDGEGHYQDMNARFAFERLQDEVMVGPEGGFIVTQDFVSEWDTGPFEMFLPGVLGIPAAPAAPQTPTMPAYPSCDYASGDDCEDEWEEWEREYEQDWEEWEQKYEQAWEEWEQEFEVWIEAFTSPMHMARASGWHVTHHDGNRTVASTYREGEEPTIRAWTQGPFGQRQEPPGTPPLTITEPLALSGPCGWKHSLQGREQDMWDPVVVHGACPPDMDLDLGAVSSLEAPLDVRVSGRDTVGGQHALVFSLPEDPDRLRLWLTRENPYPVRVLTRIPEAFPPGFAEVFGLKGEPRMYVLHEMVGFERGAAAGSPVAPDAPPLDGQRSVTGPSLGGFEHVWPLPAAWQDALDEPVECDGLREFVAQRPQAEVLEASFTYSEREDPDTGTPVVDERWSIVASDGDAALATTLHRHTETAFEPSAIPVVGEPEPVQRRNVTCDGTASVPVAGLPGPDALARTMPSVADGRDILALMGTNATGYGFSSICLDGCDAVDAVLEVGTDPTQPDAEGTVDWLALADDGGFRGRLRSESPYPEPRFSDGAWDPHAAGSAWHWQPAGAGVWNMPEPVTAGGLAAGAAAAGIIYLLWPALKGVLSAAPLFTRIRKEDLLEHPVRSQIYELVQEEPGLHFQAIVRRLEKGRGTMEHHIRKLVAGELLVEKPHRGFTCYFPKGELDRHLMAAAPALKSPGAKQVLNAVLEQPGTPAKEIAEKLGMAASTVNYHIKRLVEAGLVSQTRQGRTMALTGTGLGEQAHGRFGRT